MDDKDPTSPQEDNLRPEDRLRRILKSSEESDEALIPFTGSSETESSEEAAEPEQSETPSGENGPDKSEHTRPVSDWPYANVPSPEQSAASDLPTGPYRHAEPPAQPDLGATQVNQPVPSEPAPQPESTQPAKTDIPTQPVKVPPKASEGATRQPSGTVPARPQPPLPNRVDEVDVHATRVTPAAYGQPANRQYSAGTTRPNTAYPQQPYAQPGYGTPPPAGPTARRRAAARNGSGKRAWGCLLRGAIGLLFAGVLALLIVGSIGVYQYFRIASQLPSVEGLRTQASKFETTRILDRNGNLLYEINDPNAGKRTYVPLAKISPYLIAATLATEDKEFWSHPGYDPVAIVRALWQNYTTGEIASGASTITQQLARMVLLPNEKNERTVQRKAREIILAAEITRRYSKEEILELYLNEAYYGSMSYGIEAAAETYFNTNAGSLTLSQASFLAGLPQAPAVYDIFNNRAAALARHKAVLTLMYQDSQQKNCIDVGAQASRVCVDAPAAQAAAKEIEDYPFKLNQNTIRYPHWVNYIRTQLEAQFDAQTIYSKGFTVYTTLDPNLQDQAQAIVKQQVDALADRHVTDGALVAIRPSTGEILAMVGSADFYNDAISGQVNMAVSPRQPGSSIKPLTYLAAFEKGWTPATLIWDVPSEFPPSGDPNDPREPYVPGNYDGRFHGPVTVRTALANSYNIPAVKALQFVGIYDNPNTPGQDGLINFARRMGITTLDRTDYGLSLTLGGGEVTVLDMTSAFGIIANSGSRVPPVSITKIVDYTGNVVMEYQPPEPEQVIRPEHAYLMSSILSDNDARTPAFGPNSVLNLPFPAAVKTGTTNDYRDNWTIGYTPDLVTGVWVGNADYTPMVGTSGVTGAAPIWSQFMQFAVPTITGGSPSPFSRPPGIADKVICAVSGTEPSEYCPNQRGEVFASDQPPLPKKDDLWQKTTIDTWTGLRASAACNDFTDEKLTLNVTDKWAKKWITDTDEGRAWADEMGFKDPIAFTPSRECKPDDSHPTILFAALNDGQTITSAPLDIYAVINASNNFKSWRLQWGQGNDPVEWKNLVKESNQQFKDPEKIYTWDLKDVPAGKVITLRIVMISTNNTRAERKIKIRNQVPTATPTSTVTPTETEMPTNTPTETKLPPTETPENTNTPKPVEETNPTATVTVTTGSLFDQLPDFLKKLFSTATPKPTPAPLAETETPAPQLPTVTDTPAPLPTETAPVVDVTIFPSETSTITPTPTCTPVVPFYGDGTAEPTWTATPYDPCVTPTATLTPTPTQPSGVVIPSATPWYNWIWNLFK